MEDRSFYYLHVFIFVFARHQEIKEIPRIAKSRPFLIKPLASLVFQTFVGIEIEIPRVEFVFHGACPWPEFFFFFFFFFFFPPTCDPNASCLLVFSFIAPWQVSFPLFPHCVPIDRHGDSSGFFFFFFFFFSLETNSQHHFSTDSRLPATATGSAPAMPRMKGKKNAYALAPLPAAVHACSDAVVAAADALGETGSPLLLCGCDASSPAPSQPEITALMVNR